jgi:hypothetical protein
MSASSLSPIAQHLASRPCRLCGGTEYAHFPEIGFEHATGSAAHYFELLICRQCRRADLFAKLDILERNYEHRVVRAPGSPTYR